jgi:hypothetical protein
MKRFQIQSNDRGMSILFHRTEEYGTSYLQQCQICGQILHDSLEGIPL